MSLKFVDVKKIQHTISPELGEVLGDIESRMPKGHQYRDNDKITWAHETTHGINANVRNANFISGKKINCFYVLNGKALLLEEPNFTLKQVSPTIPQTLRGDIYNLYMIKQADNWNDRPLYTFDEWVAYQNGTATRNDLKIKDRAETVSHMWEMAVYASYVIMMDNDDERCEALIWMLNRSSILYYSSATTNKTDTYLEKIKLEEKLINFWKEFGFEFLKNI